MIQPLFPETDFSRVIQAIEQASSIHLVTHCMPDADGIGSQIALSAALKSLGKQVVMHNHDAPPAICTYLEQSELIQDGELSQPLGCDLTIALDSGSLKRLGFDASLYEDTVLVNIDHHISNDRYGDIQVIDDRYCSTGAMIYDLLIALDIQMDAVIASGIYATVITDTSSFRQATVDGNVHRMVGNLIDAGAKPEVAARSLYFSHRPERLRLLPMVLSTLQLADEGQSAWMFADENMYRQSGATARDTEGFIDYARGIMDVRVAVFIRSEDDGWKVSMRGDGVNVGAIAEVFGGGGHRYAAGFSSNQDLLDLQASLQETVTQHLG